MNENIKMLETLYRKQLPLAYSNFIKQSGHEKFNEYLSPRMPGWTENMRYPLCFHPEIVAEVFQNKFIWNAIENSDRFIPLARFLTTDHSAVNGIDDFIAIEVSDKCPVYLWNSEGELVPIADSLENFLKML